MQEKYILEGNRLIYYMPSEIDQHYAGQIRSTTDRLIDIHQVRTLIFDFSGTSFMDSAGIGVVIGRSRKLGYYQGKVFVRNLNGRLERIFTASGLWQLVAPEQEGEDE